MNWIYRQARTVIGWAGEASEDNDKAVKFIRKLGIFALENEDVLVGDDGESMLLDYGFLQTLAEYIEELGVRFRLQNWPDLWCFLEREFWTRVWIVQELAVRGIL